MKIDFPNTITIFIWLLQATSDTSLGRRWHTKDDIGIRQAGAAMVFLRVPWVILNKADLAIRNATSTGRQRAGADMRRLVGGGIDQHAKPGVAADVLDDKIIGLVITGSDIYRAADASTAVCTAVAVLVVGGGARCETGEGRVDDRGTGGIWPRLQTCVAYVFEARETELLREIEAFHAWCVADRYWECDVFEARRGHVAGLPGDSDQSFAEAWEKWREGGENEGGFHRGVWPGN